LKARSFSKRKKQKHPSNTGPIILAVAVLLVAVALAYLLLQPSVSPGVDRGAEAPYFSLPVITSDGLLTQGVDIFSLRGKVVVLEFMVSSCEVCQRMAPAVESLYQEYRGMGVTFLSVAGTFGGASAESTAQFIREYGASWTHVFDQDNSVFQKYGIEGTPTYFVIDRTGIILSRFEGMTPTAAFKAAIDIALSG